ncbi:MULTISPECIES: biosynthetic peptidoglycan transglycosylase [Staphylococcus]|uniref:peptidoglycan glycosyltransferase n=1 Tax=Staphylococcus xylosus TaxID=1288 RepID=A0A418ISB2_STAXY|nr:MULTISPECIES: biosynthetic peptidoglycan transglycosylase [Staphylococcus]MBF0814205.1 transglycosylase domain-containing protein [Staphylococcus saprophyticus]MDW8542431.1 biosynthetic peptidoglycan transglycosylase [Staphylococcus sp. KG4-1]MRF37288.1 transglycosylase [Staphylococcus sp. KY49P]MDW8561808.1 biosynthetic peptidoglycan transglycosylase [Staphylococcus sp. KG4-3]NQD98713.1 transglycosylase domain-containing protein [Staphylococcus xylosus]
MTHQTVENQHQPSCFDKFESIYKKLKHIFIGLFAILTCTSVIILAITVFYFQSITKEAIHMSDDDLKLKLLYIVGSQDIDYDNKHILTEYNESMNTLIVGPKNVNKNVIKALTASEDSLFFRHNGILPKALVRAVGQDIFNTESATGGSTITQQLVKNQLLTNEKTYNRKANELVLSMRAEKLLTKDEIIYTYLNIVPFGRDYNGSNISGIASASYSLFGKSPSDLNIAESAYLVGLLQSPYFYTPYEENGTLKSDADIQIGLDRQHYVLKRMLVEGKITEYDYKRAERFSIRQHLLSK